MRMFPADAPNSVSDRLVGFLAETPAKPHIFRREEQE